MVLLALGGEIEVSMWLGCGEVARPAKFTGGTVAAMFYPLVETEVWLFLSLVRLLLARIRLCATKGTASYITQTIFNL